jgi:hypothetical protein
MNRRPTLGRLVVVATVLAVAVLSGCGSAAEDTSEAVDQASGDQHRRDGPTATPTTSVQEPHQSTGHTTQEGSLQVEIRVGDQRFTASVDDTPAGRDLLAQLPQIIQMRDHGGVEKTGPLRAPLDLDGQPAGADPTVGDLGYFAPGNDLVLYYGDQTYYDGIVILGTLGPDATSRLAELTGDITAHVAVLDS